MAAATMMYASAGTATDDSRLRDAVGKSVAALLRSGPSFVKVSGCVSCHNNTLPVMAASLARSRGVAVDEENVKQQVKTIVGVMNGFRQGLLEMSDGAPDVQVSGPYILMALAAEKRQPDELTAAFINDIASKQFANGSWTSFINRAPLENGDIQATALSVRALKLYGMPGRSAEWKRRVAEARAWLQHATPVTTEDRTMLVAGLAWSGASDSEVRRAANALVQEQRPDGGWAQLAALDSDAYATGKALVTLVEAGMLTPDSEPFRRGVDYLLRTQGEDGTWLVKTRAFPFQPLKESGFPHGRDQWISAAGTSWASMALSYALPETLIAHP